MSLTVKVIEAKAALDALVKIGAEVKLPVKAAWRVARLTSKLQDIAKDVEKIVKGYVEEAGLQMYRDEQGDTRFMRPVRVEGESEESWAKKVSEYTTKVREVTDKSEELGQEEVTVDCDAIPLSLFEPSFLNPSDLVGLGPFVVDDTETK